MVVRSSSFFLSENRPLIIRRGGESGLQFLERLRAPPLPFFLSLSLARGRIDRDDLLSCVVVVLLLLCLFFVFFLIVVVDRRSVGWLKERNKKTKKKKTKRRGKREKKES